MANKPVVTDAAPPAPIVLGAGGVILNGKKSTSRVVNAAPNEKYILGKPYRPKADHNQQTWNRIQAALTKGPRTLSEIGVACDQHTDFVGYMIRGGHLIPAKAEAK